MTRLADELTRVFGDPPTYPRAVIRLQVGEGSGVAAGRDEADRMVDAGCDLVVLDSDADDTAVTAALARLLHLEPVELVDRSSPTWADDVVALRSALRAPVPEQAPGVLGRLEGLLSRLVERRTPVLLGGGRAVATAALAVSRRQPDVGRWLLAGSTPDDPHAARALAQAGLAPLLDLGLGSAGADVAVAVVRAGLEALGA